jgi:hypothetical protein
MIEIIYVLLFLFAVILMFYAIYAKIPYVALLDSIIWLIFSYISAGGIDVQTMHYNATLSAYEPYVYTIVSDSMVALSYLWLLLGIIMLIFFITFTLEYLYKPPKDMG